MEMSVDQLEEVKEANQKWKYNKRTSESYAPINIKPEGGGGGSGNPREFDCGVYPQGGDFDRTLCISSFTFIE